MHTLIIVVYICACLVRNQLRMVLRDRLGQCLVGLKREQQIDTLRDLGLVRLTRGLV
jgi:hypothetical protein